MTDALLAATAPVFNIDGQVNGQLARDVSRLEVEEDTSGMKRLMLRLIAQGPQRGTPEEELLYLIVSILDFGKRLLVSIGPEESARTVFDGFISALEVCLHEAKEPEAVVFAEDRLMRLRTTRRMNTYEKMSDADVAQAIAQQRKLESWQAILARAGGHVRKSFRIASERDGNLIKQARNLGQAGFEKSAGVAAYLLGLNGANDSREIERGHKTNSADGQLHT